MTDFARIDPPLEARLIDLIDGLDETYREVNAVLHQLVIQERERKSTTFGKLQLPDEIDTHDLAFQVWRARRFRSRIFEPNLFGEPSWDILLFLYAAYPANRRQLTKAVITSAGVPDTTALRYIALLTTAGLLVKSHDDNDRRRRFLSISDLGVTLMHRYLSDVIIKGHLGPI